MSRTIPLVAFLVCCFLSLPAAAAVKGGFSADELKTLQPLLKKHDTIGLTEFNKDGTPEQMTLALRIRAKRETVFNLFRDPDNFYYISTLFKENVVRDQHQNAMVWTWASRHNFFSIVGRNNIALFPPRRADVTIEESSVGSGKFTLRFYEDGEHHTILVLSGFLEVQSSEWLIRFLVGDSPAMKQAMNIAIGFVILKGTRALAERVERGKKRRKHRTAGPAGGTPTPLPTKEIEQLKPLLKRGQLFLCDSHNGGRLKQAVVIDRVRSAAAKFEAAASVPANYAKHINAISGIDVHGKSNGQTEFSWKLGFSIFGISSRNLLGPTEGGVLLQSIGGDLEGARWRWQIVPESSATSIVAYHAYADPSKTSIILETTVKREPYLEHGLILGSNIVMLNAMRKITEAQ